MFDILKLPRPDLNILLDCNMETTKKNMLSRGEEDANEKNSDLQLEVSKNYLKLSLQNNELWNLSL